MAATIGDIDGCRHLFLHGVSEPNDHELRLLIAEAKLGEIDNDVVVGRTIFPSRPIRYTEDCRLFEVHWLHCAAYLVRDEAYAVPDSYDQFSGQRFVLYSKSRFLDLMLATTIKELVGPIRHWGILCLNHVVDVISKHDPVVRIARAPRRS
jgi:hypothetical protein